MVTSPGSVATEGFAPSRRWHPEATNVPVGARAGGGGHLIYSLLQLAGRGMAGWFYRVPGWVIVCDVFEIRWLRVGEW